MFTPSNIRIDDSDLKIERVEDGLYTVENAYEGEYEYFSGRPINLRESEHILQVTDAADSVSLEEKS